MDASSTLPTEPAERKTYPIATGVLDYFPRAIAAIAQVSLAGNEQHHPGKPLHWDRSKSTDEADALMRHFLERGKLDSDGQRHSAKVAWRALALLEKELEREQQSVAPWVDEERRREGAEPPCKSVAPYMGGWASCSCERQEGHTGDHLAWDEYETRELYENGRWPQQPTPLQNCPRPGGAF